MKPVLTRVLRSLQSNILAGLLTVGAFCHFSDLQFCGGGACQGGITVVHLAGGHLPEGWLSQPGAAAGVWRLC